MKYQDLPNRWKNKVAEYLKSIGEDRSKFGASDFPSSKVTINFEDDSYAEFKYSLVIKAPELREVGIFTEHCGYHIFNLYGTSINIVDVQ